MRPGGAEQRLQELGIQLPAAPTPFGTYVETLRTGNLLFLSGMLPVVDHKPKYVGRLGKELDAEAGRDAAYAAALSALAAARKHLGSLDRVTRWSGSAYSSQPSGTSSTSPGSRTPSRICFAISLVPTRWRFDRSSELPAFLSGCRSSSRSPSKSNSRSEETCLRRNRLSGSWHTSWSR
jgi:enamine deaminase RidA (YjgF/YER057c/UK114 family)